MKQLVTLLLLGALVSLASCTDYPPLFPPQNGGGHGPKKVPTVTTSGSIPAVRTSLTFKGTINNTGGLPILGRFFIVTWTDPLTGTAEADTIQVQSGGNTFSYTKTDCYPGLGYSYQAGAVNSAGIGYGQISTSYNAGMHVGQDLGYGMVIHPYANYDSAIVVSKYELNTYYGLEWGFSTITGTSSALLAGRTNTDAIIAQTAGWSAAQLCRSYAAEGKKWNLASAQELQKIWTYRNAIAIAGSFYGGYVHGVGNNGAGNYATMFYWSSTQAASGDVYALDFAGSTQQTVTALPGLQYGIRPITYVGAP